MELDMRGIKPIHFLDDSKWTATTELCHGCGACTQYCPVSIATNDESSSARAKANLLRGVLSGKLDLDSLLSSDMMRLGY